MAEASLDDPVGPVARPAHHLGAGLLHLPAVRRADGEGARLVAHRDVRRAVGRPAGRGPVLDPGRRVDRSRPCAAADDRRLAAGGRPDVRLVAGRIAADVLRHLDRPRRLPVGHALRARLRGDHPRLRFAFPPGHHGDDVRWRSGQHLRHSLRAAADRAHRLAADAGRARGHHPRRRHPDPRAVRARPEGGGDPDRPAQEEHRRQEPARQGGAGAGLLGAGRGLRGLRARLLGDELPPDPAARRARRRRPAW